VSIEISGAVEATRYINSVYKGFTLFYILLSLQLEVSTRNVSYNFVDSSRFRKNWYSRDHTVLGA
jgi:hypothetical protein